MIVQAFLSLIVSFINILFAWLPQVTALPMINGYDIDTAMVKGVAQTYRFAQFIWPISYVLLGAGFLWTYYGIKMLLRLVLGHRAPA